MLLVLNTRSIALSEPRKSVEEIVFPDLLHSVRLAGTFDQLARPVASEISTLFNHGVPPVILICPATSNFAQGVVVQIPILAPFP